MVLSISISPSHSLIPPLPLSPPVYSVMSDSEWDDSDTDDSSPAAAPSADVSASSASAVVASSAAPPTMLIAFPIQLCLPAHAVLAAGIPAGITLLYDAIKNIITILAYDAHKR